jgi:hypothetical protein
MLDIRLQRTIVQIQTHANKHSVLYKTSINIKHQKWKQIKWIKQWIQSTHIEHMSVLWMMSMCRTSVVFTLNSSSHSSHLKGFWTECDLELFDWICIFYILFILCVIRTHFLAPELLCTQIPIMWMWTFAKQTNLIWILRFPPCAVLYGHSSHWYGRSNVCMARMWRRRSPLEANAMSPEDICILDIVCAHTRTNMLYTCDSLVLVVWGTFVHVLSPVQSSAQRNSAQTKINK